ncbi:DNA photolyase family protein [SAR86 cluster bacterium]|nr:DNA photolyase family protein [SAR86 cluster bacterium]
MNSLVWLRTDLRIDDNPALKNACKNSKSVEAIYIFSEDQIKKHYEANCKIDFLIQSLKDLNKSLKKLNIPLTIIKSKNIIEIPRLILDYSKQNNINKLFLNNEFGEDEKNRDDAVKVLLKKNDIISESFHDKVLFEPGFLKTGQGKPFSVFTPFKRRWIENFKMELLDIDFTYPIFEKSNLKSNVNQFDFKFKKSHKVDMTNWKIGEQESKKILKKFLSKKVYDYSKDRNDPILDGTSRLSPYLSLGIISPKRCILEAMKLNNFEFTSGNIGITKWVDEIVWREFYKNIMYCFPKVSKGMPFQDYTNSINWLFDSKQFEAWKNGATGFPIIDAAMRQLMHEGWMHNRLRMVVAMFFTKNMLHDWRLGEEFFMKNLIDGDFASNNGGWQWSSSTGTDAAPYFRIFNPITQSKNFDKDGSFIKKYVPELKDLDKSSIHDPSDEHRKYLKYPNKILDLKTSRIRAVEAFNLAKKSL